MLSTPMFETEPGTLLVTGWVHLANIHFAVNVNVNVLFARPLHTIALRCKAVWYNSVTT